MAEQNVGTDDLTLDEQVAILVDDLPEPVRNFLKSSERDLVSLDLSQKYRLHADAAGAFERAYLFMLLGVFTPDEFVNELHKADIDEQTIRGLAEDVNERVFKRLREEEKHGRLTSADAITQERPQVSVMEIGRREDVPENLPGQRAVAEEAVQPSPFVAPPVSDTPSAPVPAPAASASLYATPPEAVVPSAYEMPSAAYMPPSAPSAATPSVPVPTPAPMPYQAPVSAPAPIYSDPAPMAPSGEIYRPTARTMESDIERLTQQPAQQPASFPQPPVAAPAPTPPMPFQAPNAAPAPAYTPEPTMPQPAPISEAPTGSSSYPPPAMAPVRFTPVDRAYDNAPITKEYGNDPYREPIEQS